MGSSEKAPTGWLEIPPAASNWQVHVDYYCTERRLIIEVDGGIHNLFVQEDIERTKVLQDRGYKVIRFCNDAIEHNIDQVLNTIANACRQDE